MIIIAIIICKRNQVTRATDIEYTVIIGGRAIDIDGISKTTKDFDQDVGRVYHEIDSMHDTMVTRGKANTTV